jgi:hypothetical protein
MPIPNGYGCEHPGVVVKTRLGGVFFSTDIYKISAETRNLVPLQEILILFKKGDKLKLNFTIRSKGLHMPVVLSLGVVARKTGCNTEDMRALLSIEDIDFFSFILKNFKFKICLN